MAEPPDGWVPLNGCPTYAPGCSCPVLLLAAYALRPDLGPEDFFCFDNGLPDPAGFLTVYVRPMPGLYALQVYRSRSGTAATTDDDLVNVLHWNFEGAGDPATADFEAVEDRVVGFFDDIASYLLSDTPIYQMRWYRAGESAPNPAVRIFDAGPFPAFTGGDYLPPQIAETLTFLTSNRRRWGRIYIGGLDLSALHAPTGRVASSFIGALVAAANIGFQQDVPDWEFQVAAANGSSGLRVNDVRADDVFDVIRSRRYGTAFERVDASLNP